MTGYRMAEEPDDPLAVDEAKVAAGLFRAEMTVHLLVTLFSAGIWLPFVLIRIPFGRRHAKRRASGYRVRLRRDALSVGNREHAASVPLDMISTVKVVGGAVHVVTVGTGTAPLVIHGLLDPLAAVDAILDARGERLSAAGVARVRVAAPTEEVDETDEAEVAATPARRDRRE